MRRHFLLIAGCLSVVALLSGAPLEAPTLSAADNLKVQNALQRIEIAHLRAQIAQTEFDRAKQAAEVLLKTLQVPGYTLDLGQLVYVPTPAPEAVKKDSRPLP